MSFGKVGYRVEKHYERDTWICTFLMDGRPDIDERGTYCTGKKEYAARENAKSAGERYVRRMCKIGFAKAESLPV